MSAAIARVVNAVAPRKLTVSRVTFALLASRVKSLAAVPLEVHQTEEVPSDD